VPFLLETARHIQHGIALIPEDRGNQGLILPLTIRENITLPVVNRIKRFGMFIDKKKEKKIIQSSMDQLEIKAANADIEVMTLSGGNQQKVVFAKMFAAEPKVFLLYDCTRGVDVGTKAEIFTLVRELAQKGNVLLYYSTDIDELVHICDKVAVMFDGKIAAVVEGNQLTKENILLASVGETVGAAAPNSEK
jgi:ribose transport system ATP-binding protein